MGVPKRGEPPPQEIIMIRKDVPHPGIAIREELCHIVEYCLNVPYGSLAHELSQKSPKS
jgi:hypothetical protein